MRNVLTMLVCYDLRRPDAVQDLGLDDFLAKLKAVTGRSNGMLVGSAAASAAPSDRAYKSDIASLDAEIEQLKSGADGSAVVKRRAPAFAQRSAAPPSSRAPAHPPFAQTGGAVDEVALVSGNGDAVFIASGVQHATQSADSFQAQNAPDDVALISGDESEVFNGGTANPVLHMQNDSRTRPGAETSAYRSDGTYDQSQNEIQNKISRMQKALAQSREMRASLLNMDIPRLAPQQFAMPAKNPARAVRGAPPGTGPPVVARSPHAQHPAYTPVVMQPPQPQPWQDVDTMRKGQIPLPMESPPRPPPQLLPKNDGKPSHGMGDAPISEQELLAHVSKYYGADPSLQDVLWSMISGGAIRNPRELRAAAEDLLIKRGNLPTPASSRSTGPQQQWREPHHHQPAPWAAQQGGWAQKFPPHQDDLSQSMDMRVQRQTPAALSQSFDLGAPRPRHQHAQVQHYGPQRQGPPGMPFPPRDMPRGIQSAQPPVMQQTSMRSQDHDILSRSFGEISKLAASPTYGSAMAPNQASKAPMQSMQQGQGMNQRSRRHGPPMQMQMQQMMPPMQPQPGSMPPQNAFGVMPRGPPPDQHAQQSANSTVRLCISTSTSIFATYALLMSPLLHRQPIIPVDALSTEEKYNLIDEGYNHGEML